MAKRLTVFYSWQSDSPANLNRSFIEKALHEALERLHSEATLEIALRDTTVELDKDTKNVPGSPPITDTILRKIEECGVFVADLSFVGESKSGFSDASGNPRQFPNPNVLIEYGYALHCHSHTKLIGIMNTAYGEPDEVSLPFNLRHLRRPISYHLTDSSASDKNSQFENLVQTLFRAIGLILSNHSSRETIVEKFAPQKATANPAVFFEKVEELFGDRHDSYTIPNGGKAYLRLYPITAVPKIETPFVARTLATSGGLRPMGRLNGWGFDRNIFGAIAYETTQDPKLCQFTQLFLSREIWGVDAWVLDTEKIREQLQRWVRDDSTRYIAYGYVEQYFIEALQNYLAFAEIHLKLPLPLQIEAGLTGIKDYSLALNASQFYGKALQDTTIWQGEVSDYRKPAWEILAPFFDLIWDNCNLQRAAQQQAELNKRYIHQI